MDVTKIKFQKVNIVGKQGFRQFRMGDVGLAVVPFE